MTFQWNVKSPSRFCSSPSEMSFFTFNMSNFNPEVLIKAVEQRPGLWDKSLDAFKDKRYRVAAWREISRLLNPDYDDLMRNEKIDYERLVQNKWTNIRDAYKKNLVVQEAHRKSGSLKKPPRQYYYHDQLKFLLKNDITEKQTINELLEPYINNSNESYEASNKVESMEDNTSQITQDDVDGEMSAVDLKMMKFMDEHLKYLSKRREEDNRHLLFFRSILPSLDGFSDEETLVFQAGVLNLVQGMKRNGKVET